MNHADELHREQKETLIKLRKALPPFTDEFFRGIESSTEIRTRIAYAVDLNVFFEYLTSEDERFCSRTPERITLEDMRALSVADYERFIEYLGFYKRNDIIRENANCGKARKLSSLRAMVKYFVKKQLLNVNMPALVTTPKLHEQPKIRLEANEVADLLDIAESGESMSKKQKQYHDKTAVRDVAILSLFLGTGIRISELVGIDTDDIDIDNHSFRITRKGGYKDVLYFNDEVADALIPYLSERAEMAALGGSEKALFLSLQKKRITVRAVQNLVKKYSSQAVPLKHITPHKLRKTYGTMLYLETGDIYLVANALGHKDVNTTRKHYADTEEVNKRMAARVIKLRRD